MIGRYKGPGSKTSILACINRKGKALGCTSKSSDSVVEPKQEAVFNMPQCDSIAVATDEEIRALYNKAEAEMCSRNLKPERPCAKCADHEAETKKAQDQVTEVTQKLQDSENVIGVLRGELRFHAMDYAAQVDANIEIQKQLDEVRKEKLSIVGALSGKYKSIEEGKDSLSSEENIDALETSIMDGVNFEDIFSKVNDGTHHAPKPGEPLDDPSGNADNGQINMDNLTFAGKAAIETFKEHLNSGRMLDAERYFNKMKSINIFPEEFEYEKLSAVLKPEDADK